MFKEFFVLLLVFLFVYMLFLKVYRINRKILQRMAIVILILLSILNIIYNYKNIYPIYIYENKPLGDRKENLFSYKQDSEFQWQILFPILKNRKVYLDTSGSDYYKFFQLYSDSAEYINIPEEVKNTISGDLGGFSTNIALTMIDLLSYAFEPDNVEKYYEDNPYLRINIESLQDNPEIVALVDENMNLYIMSLEYYKSFNISKEED